MTQNAATSLSITTKASALRSGLTALGASFFIAFMAQITVPFYPVPMTMQPMAVLLVAMLLPRSIAFGAIAAYYVEALLGLPVLAGGGAGLGRFVGPTAGYLFGYVLMTGVISSFYPQSKTWLRKLLVVMLGYGFLYISGVVVLSLFIGLNGAIETGILPFLLKDVFQVLLAMGLVHNVSPILARWKMK